MAAALLLGLSAMLYADGAVRRSTGVAAGIGPQIPAQIRAQIPATTLAEPERRLIVGQFNIRRARGRDGGGDLWRTAACLTGLDLIGLNEVDGGAPFGLGEDQASAFGRMLSLNAVFAPTERRFWHAHFGNGLLSGWPVRGWVRLPLPYDAGPAQRNLVYAQIGPVDDPIRVLVTHIDRRADRDRQLRAVLGYFRSLAPPVLLIGDLNATFEHPMIAEILADPQVVASNGWYPAHVAPGRVDWILARGFRAVGAEQCDVGASDHARIAIELERLP